MPLWRILFSARSGSTTTSVVLKGESNMPDWFTHTLVGWITGKTTKQDIALVVIGSLIPDLVKMNLVVKRLGFREFQIFDPLHTPVGALLVAGIITLLFLDSKKAFFSLCIGVITHFILDFFLVHVSGGMLLLFPFSWEGWQWHFIRSDDYRITIGAVMAAGLVYACYWYIYKKKNSIISKEQ